MRKWQNLAAPDDPNSWYDVRGAYPTLRGTYELGPASTGLPYTATGAGTVNYAFYAKTPTSLREYVVDSTHVWEWSEGLSAFTDRTGGVTVGTLAHICMAQLGTATICVMGSTNATVASTGGNFAAIAGSPKGEIVVVQSGAALIFNTDSSSAGWAASDVGDYTNWTTGESASGTLYQTAGPITAAVAFGGSVYVFKSNSIYRMSYVGGVVKWAVELVENGIGVAELIVAFGSGKYQAVATPHGIAFCGNDFPRSSIQLTDGTRVFLYDGTGRPRLLNPLTTVALAHLSVYTYDPVNDVLTISPWGGSSATGTQSGSTALYYYYNFNSDMWGCGVGSSGEVDASGNGSGCGVTQGEWAPPVDGFAMANTSSKPKYWAYRGTANLLTKNPPLSGSSIYLESSKIGTADAKTTFRRVTPRLRRRTGNGSASLSMSLFTELEDTSASATRTVTESTNRKRFDLLGGAATDTFARFKVTWTTLDVEVDDFLIDKINAGDN